MTTGKAFTRREFLRTGCAAAAGACVAVSGAGALASPVPDDTGHIGTLVDLTRCIGCRACVRACNERNDLPQQPHATTVWDGSRERLSFDRWTTVNRFDPGSGPAQGSGPAFVPVKQQCMHCSEPACVSVCPVGALHQMPNGAVVYRQERCIGCRYCVFACPFGVPKFEWSAGLDPVIGKCQFCAQHALFTGPACAAACPTGTLKFGLRKTLLTEARARIHARPDRYVDHVYGEHEVGGTAWLYLSNRPFDQLGFKSGLPEFGMPRLTWVALKLVPAVVTVLAGLLTALSLRARRSGTTKPAPHA